jgi:hypothetical protein
MPMQSVAVKDLRPTQIAVGKLRVKEKRKNLRQRIRQPQELVDYILSRPIRVVIGPRGLIYIVDHHHLGCALLKEGFKTAPVLVEADYSKMSTASFWKTMAAKSWVHPFDNKGKRREISEIPLKLSDMKDDPYRSLAGEVRQRGGFTKTDVLYMEFLWADYFRSLIKAKDLRSNFKAAVKKALKLAADSAATELPGYISLST